MPGIIWRSCKPFNMPAQAKIEGDYLNDYNLAAAACALAAQSGAVLP